MIIKELYMTRSDGVKLYRNYSDAGKYIIQNETGIEYSEAIDVEDAPYTYTESEKDLEVFEDEPLNGDEISAKEALDIIVGGDC